MKTNNYINDGHPVVVWGGITASRFLYRCEKANEEEARAMSLVACLMHSAEPITWNEFNDARAALQSVEKRLIENFIGPIKLNRFGSPFGGCHPALL